MDTIYEASPEAKAMIPEGTERKNDTYVAIRSKYKFSQMQIGQCFIVPFKNALNEASLRVTVSRASRTLNKKFTVIKHEKHEIFEVARIG